MHNKGKNVDQSAVVDENLKRTAKDGQSVALAMLADEPKPNKRSDEERKKIALGKASSWLNKLSRTVSTTEQSLPSWRRTLKGKEFNQLREGLVTCRDFKEAAMYQIEDIKDQEDKMDIDTYLESLEKLTKEVQEYHETLHEAITKMKSSSAVPKQEQTDPSQGDNDLGVETNRRKGE